VRPDGAIVWCSARVRVLRDAEGRIERSVAIVEDVTEQKLQTERAARIQRRLLPKAALEIEGYELAGACRPALDVAGDFYDWVAGPDGHVDLTLADVMGKGMGSALLMAVVRTALRVARPELGPAARVRIAAESIGRGITDEGLFVTMFHARLDCNSGRLVYVDAGHGYCAVRRRDGEVLRLPARSLPLGVIEGDAFAEGTVQLEPGDLLLLYSDGLVEREEGTVRLDDLARHLDAATTATDVVARLMDTSPLLPPDDVTVVTLRRA
jgi:serine phosphatase RsbU (regulator of sigma subunit)